MKGGASGREMGERSRERETKRIRELISERNSRGIGNIYSEMEVERERESEVTYKV